MKTCNAQLSPQQVAQRAAKVRKSWSKTEAHNRRVIAGMHLHGLLLLACKPYQKSA